MLAFASYYFADACGQSGIISIIVTSVIMGQYTWYNLSPQGKHVTAVTFQTLGFGAEAIIFSFVGLGIFQYAKTSWSPSFVVLEFFVIIAARYGAVFIVEWLFLICTKRTLTNKELAFLSYAGMIRGAIAFGLAVETWTDPTVLTSVLVLVMATTVIFGSLMPLVTKCLLKGPPELIGIEDLDSSRTSAPKNVNASPQNSGEASLDDRHSHYSNFVHPNQAPSERPTELTKIDGLEVPKETGWLVRKLAQFDTNYLKPWFIYNYSAEEIEAEAAF